MSPPDLILHNAGIRTMDRATPRATAVAIRAGRILAVGDPHAVRETVGPRWEEVDCRGALILPAFIDAHLHLLSYAASLSAVDCSPATVGSIPELLEAIRQRAAHTPLGRWIRAIGYRETELAERRDPTRWELDAAAPNNPVRLIHGSGHGAVLNSAALAAAGITNETEEPPGAFIGRRVEDGTVDGLLLEMNALLDARLPTARWEEVRQGVAEACRRLLAAGITSVHDLGVQNDRRTLETFSRLKADAALTVDLVAALGFDAFVQRSPVEPWTGLVKIVINELDGAPSPDVAALAGMISRIHDAGAQACLHAVSADACATAVQAFEEVLAGRPASDHRHRIEHAAICPPELATRIARLGVVVVANPGFLHVDGDRYLRQVPAGSQPILHNPAALREAGVCVAFGSDAPVSAPRPLRTVAAAVSRMSGSGKVLPGAHMTLDDALAAHTLNAAFSARQEHERGRLAAGTKADLVVLPSELVDGLGGGGVGPAHPGDGWALMRVMSAGAWT